MGMRNLCALALLAATAIAAPALADTKDANKKPPPAKPSNVTWAMLKTGDAKLMLFADRDHIAQDGTATVVIATGAPTDKVKKVAVDVELLFAKDKNSRKVISSWRQEIEVDSKTHEIPVPVSVKGKLDPYSIMVRAVDNTADTKPDAVDSTISIEHLGSNVVVLGLGK